MHMLWQHKFTRRDPQNLADAIREVEKLQVAQQLTATLLPSSTVNVMLSEDENIFSVKNQGTWHATVPV